MEYDRVVKWKNARLWLPATKADDVIGTAGADTGQSAGGPIVAVQAGAGFLGVVQMGANSDEITFFIPIPWDLDRDRKVLGRVVFCHSSTDADAPVFNVKTKFHAKQAAVVDMDTNDDQAVAFAAHTCSTTAESLEITAWTDLEWNQSIASSDVFAGIILACTTISGSANEVELLGLELAYSRAALGAHKDDTDKMLAAQPL